MISALLLIICGYVMGSIPTGFWLVKTVKGIDIRSFGSGSTGATNVWRAAGPVAGIFTFFFDTIKGWIPVATAVYLDTHNFESQWNFGCAHIVPSIVAAAALVGHSRSIFLKFTGGKSAATGLGTLLALSPLGGLCTFLTWMLIVKLSGYISLASILGVGSCPFWFYAFGAPLPAIGYCIFGFIYVTYRHKANIQRMLKGTEPKITDKKKADSSEATKIPDTTSSTTEST
ncbi:MAG TPA: glycerol-3-phosphate 1-O-acyltransferase PlsY [Drouetiella sp.]